MNAVNDRDNYSVAFQIPQVPSENLMKSRIILDDRYNCDHLENI